MKTVFLDGERIRSKADVHTAFASALSFPKHYGNNLDALHDMLTEGKDEIGVIAVNTDMLSDNLGKWWNSLLRLLGDVANERTGFNVLIDPFEKIEK